MLAIPEAPAIYVRWSTEEQGSGTTLEEQRQTCLSFLNERGWPVCPDLIFIDEGFSAGSLERPAMRKLRKAVHSGKVDTVVVYKLDRLTRNIVDAVDLVLKEWEGRCALVSVTQASIDTTNALGRQFFTLMASFAEFERDMIRDRTMSGKKRRAMQGRNPGFRPPYGYMTGDTPGSVIVDEGKAVVVRRVFELFSSGVSQEGVARQLNREGIPTQTGTTRWTYATVRYMLRNQLYMGTLEYGKSSRNSPQRRSIVGAANTFYKVPRHAVVPNAVPPIVSVELWETVQANLKQRSKACGFQCRAASSQYLLSGLLRCRCGAACAGVDCRGVHYYRCRSGTGECNCTAMRADVLENAVVEAIRHQLRSWTAAGVLQDTSAKLEESKRAVEATVAHLKGAVAEVTRQREKARKDYMAGDLSGRLYSEVTTGLDQREGETKAALREAEQALANPTAVAPDKAWLLEHMDQVMTDAWDELDMSRKKHLLRLLVRKLTGYRDKGASFVSVDVTLSAPDGDPRDAVTYTREHFYRGRRVAEDQASD